LYPVVFGKLITKIRAENLTAVDWKGIGGQYGGHFVDEHAKKKHRKQYIIGHENY